MEEGSQTRMNASHIKSNLIILQWGMSTFIEGIYIHQNGLRTALLKVNFKTRMSIFSLLILMNSDQEDSILLRKRNILL